MAILFVGIDLAKNVFAIHGVDEHGKAVLVRPSVPRARLHQLVAALPPCTIGIEACSGAHHWARLFAQHGHTVRLMAPKFVAPYRMSGKRGKTDAADAQAICEAVQRPNMRFVPVKSQDEQARLCIHRVRQGFVEQRTATINRLRGLLSEFGIVQADAATRCWLYHGERARLDGRGRARLQERSSARSVARLGARAVQLGRQDPPRAHHQGWRRLFANSPGPGRQVSAGRGQEQAGPAQPLGDGTRGATRLLEGGHRDRGQERAHGLGRARQGRGPG